MNVIHNREDRIIYHTIANYLSLVECTGAKEVDLVNHLNSHSQPYMFVAHDLQDRVTAWEPSDHPSAIKVKQVWQTFYKVLTNRESPPESVQAALESLNNEVPRRLARSPFGQTGLIVVPKDYPYDLLPNEIYDNELDSKVMQPYRRFLNMLDCDQRDVAFFNSVKRDVAMLFSRRHSRETLKRILNSDKTCVIKIEKNKKSNVFDVEMVNPSKFILRYSEIPYTTVHKTSFGRTSLFMPNFNHLYHECVHIRRRLENPSIVTVDSQTPGSHSLYPNKEEEVVILDPLFGEAALQKDCNMPEREHHIGGMNASLSDEQNLKKALLHNQGGDLKLRFPEYVESKESSSSSSSSSSKKQEDRFFTPLRPPGSKRGRSDPATMPSKSIKLSEKLSALIKEDPTP